MKTYIIKANELEAINLASSIEASRYYLCGVLIEPLEDGTVALVATDGHRLASLRYMPQNPAAKDAFILATDDIKKIISMVKAEAKTTAKRLRDDLRIKLEKDGVNLKLSVVLLDKEGTVIKTDGSFSTKEVDGSFPDYARLIPSCDDSTTSEISFNTDYMADFGKMTKLITGQRVPQIKMQISDVVGPIKITMPHNSKFLGVLMPMRA